MAVHAHGARRSGRRYVPFAEGPAQTPVTHAHVAAMVQVGVHELVCLCLALLVLLIGVASATESRAGDVPRFEGTVGPGVAGHPSDEKAFLKFVEANYHKIIFLDILLNDRQADEMSTPVDEEGGRKRYFFAIPDDWSAAHLGGTEIDILVSPDDDFVFDPTPSPRLAGYFKVIGGAGPHTGYFVHILKPVNVENVRSGGRAG